MPHVKKIITLSLLLCMLAVPAHALNILERLIYREVRVGNEVFLVNKATDKVEKRLVGKTYVPVSTQQGFNGIISDQEMYQAQYERAMGR